MYMYSSITCIFQRCKNYLAGEEGGKEEDFEKS
jgi:hypothetical protein